MGVVAPALQTAQTYKKGEPDCCPSRPGKLGAEEGTRTLDLLLGKEALYQLSYFRSNHPTSRSRQGLSHVLEREMGLEPTTPSLGSWCSTTELFPLLWSHYPCIIQKTPAGRNRFPGVR